MELITVNNYLKIYLWRVLSVVSGFLSLVIVIPHLSTQQELFGIYTFCIAFSLYLSYADIGFLSSGQKFAGEEYAKGNQVEEVEIEGFSLFLLLLLFLPFSIFMVYLSVDPGVVLKGLSRENSDIAGELFLIIGLLLPIQVFLQRVVEFALLIRLKDYISLKIDITFNLIKIFSVYFFFKDGNYPLIEYYLFITLLSIFGSLLSIIVIKRVIKYDFYLLLKSIRFKDKHYQKGKNLALSSFASTLSFIVYYELDLLIIGRWFGIQEVAIYAIGFTFLNFMRNLWNILYSPFSQQLNHFSGKGLIDKIASMLAKITEYTIPLYVVLVLVLVLGAEQLVIFWVGDEYTESIIIFQILILSTIFGAIDRPATYYFITCLKYKYIYAQAIILPIVFVFSIFLLIDNLGMTSIAVAKFIVAAVSSLIAIKGILSIFSPAKILKKTLVPIIIFVVLTYIYFPNVIEAVFIEPQKDVVSLVRFLVFLSAVIILSYTLIIVSSKARRHEIRSALVGYFNKEK